MSKMENTQLFKMTCMEGALKLYMMLQKCFNLIMSFSGSFDQIKIGQWFTEAVSVLVMKNYHATAQFL